MSRVSFQVRRVLQQERFFPPGPVSRHEDVIDQKSLLSFCWRQGPLSMVSVITWALQQSTAWGAIDWLPTNWLCPHPLPWAWVSLPLPAPCPRCLLPLIAEKKGESDNINKYINQKRQMFLIQVGLAAPMSGTWVGCPSEVCDSCCGGPSMPWV